MENNYLAHHGTKGQRWGFRRYQYKDGTLTPAGRRRAAELAAKREKLDSKYNKLVGIKSTSKQESQQPKKQSIKDLSDEELKNMYTRLKLEQSYIETYKKLNPQKEKLSKKFISAFTDKAINELADMSVKKGRAYLESKFFQ